MDLLQNFGAALIGFIIVVVSIPSIVKIAKAKNLFEPFEARKVHTKQIPPLGGIAIFLGFTLSLLFSTSGLDSLKYFIAAILILFFIGLKDDLLVMSAKSKLVFQILAALLVIIFGDVQITNLHGVFRLYEIHYLFGVFISLLLVLTIINAFNLIDGVDGLASGLGIVAGLVFGTWFYISGHMQFAIISFALVGSLAGFFIFNVFSTKNKLFMGDMGSLVVGLIISIIVIKFNEFNIVKTYAFSIKAAPSVSFAIIIIPLVDTFRVMCLRIYQGNSPFTPDRNHLHHRLLELVGNHLGVTAIMIFTNLLFIGFAFFLNAFSINLNIQILLILTTGIFLSLIPSQIISSRKVATSATTKVFTIETGIMERA
jgi:UDP-GlcNAc:undecaprenyl-phosphate/decaprenyl-phosphate GlcNAc-1-phosphate transferase